MKGRQQFLPDIRRVAHNHVEPTLGENLGKRGLPVKCIGVNRRIADDAVAFADGVVEAGQLLAARGGLDPQAKLADLDGLGVKIHTVKVVLQDLPVEVEEGALAAQFLQPGVGSFIDGVELVEGLDEKSAAAAGGSRMRRRLSSSCQASQNRIRPCAADR